MKKVTYVVYFLAAIALLAGAIDIINGVAGVNFMGGNMIAADPMLDNLFRFFAALWFGIGLQLIFFSRDYPRNKRALIFLLAIVAMGGLVRLISIAQLGFPASGVGVLLVSLGLVSELIIAPVLIFFIKKACERKLSLGFASRCVRLARNVNIMA